MAYIILHKQTGWAVRGPSWRAPATTVQVHAATTEARDIFMAEAENYFKAFRITWTKTVRAGSGIARRRVARRRRS